MIPPDDKAGPVVPDHGLASQDSSFRQERTTKLQTERFLACVLSMVLHRGLAGCPCGVGTCSVCESPSPWSHQAALRGLPAGQESLFLWLCIWMPAHLPVWGTGTPWMGPESEPLRDPLGRCPGPLLSSWSAPVCLGLLIPLLMLSLLRASWRVDRPPEAACLGTGLPVHEEMRSGVTGSMGVQDRLPREAAHVGTGGGGWLGECQEPEEVTAFWRHLG